MVEDKYYGAITIHWIFIADIVGKHILTSLKSWNFQDFFLKTKTFISRPRLGPRHLSQDQDIYLKTKTRTKTFFSRPRHLTKTKTKTKTLDENARPRPSFSKLVLEELRDQDLISRTSWPTSQYDIIFPKLCKLHSWSLVVNCLPLLEST